MFRRKPKITAEISNLQEEYFTADVVEGVVVLGIPTDDANNSSEEKLVVKLVGYFNNRDSNVVAGPGTGAASFAYATELKDRIIWYSVSVTPLKGFFGRQSFPFSVVLPEVLPPSMEAFDGPNQFAIVYGIEVGIDRPGALKLDVMTKKKFELRNRPVEIAGKAMTAGPETCAIGGCCSKGGSVTIGFKMDRDVAVLREPLRVAVVTRSDSKFKIKTMRIELKQHIEWEAQASRNISTRSISTVAVPGSQLVNVQHAMDQIQGRGQDAAVIARATREDLQACLASGSTMKYEILVPDNCTVDVRTANVMVTHSLCVQLEIGYHVPEVCIPLCVQENTDATDKRVAASATTESSYIVANAPAGSIQTVFVPDSAVNVDFRREVQFADW